ncbi:hypothetical protein AAKU55_002782 [Oxalobacteraceae bacterium GrIS 1.11]
MRRILATTTGDNQLIRLPDNVNGAAPLRRLTLRQLPQRALCHEERRQRSLGENFPPQKINQSLIPGE